MEYDQRVNESAEDYFVRLYLNKNTYGLTSEQCADLMNRASGVVLGESAWRKKAKAFISGMRYAEKKVCNDYLNEQVRELEKQRIRIQDQRSALKKELRKDARLDALMDSMRDVISGYDPIVPFELEMSDNGNKTIVAILSDWHIGATYANSHGEYSIEIARDFVEQYAGEVVKTATLYDANRCVVLIAGDCINGVIHGLGAENSAGVVGQLQIASELVSNFVGSISEKFKSIDVYGVSGNHSRITEHSDNAKLGDMLDDFIMFYAEARLANFKNVKVHTKEANEGYVDFYIGSNHCVLAHGDLDSCTEGGICRLQQMTEGIVDYLFVGHLHRPEMISVVGTTIVRGGSFSVSGSDYALKRRLCGRPSQMMAVFDDDSLVAAMPIYFD